VSVDKLKGNLCSFSSFFPLIAISLLHTSLELGSFLCFFISFTPVMKDNETSLVLSFYPSTRIMIVCGICFSVSLLSVSILVYSLVTWNTG